MRLFSFAALSSALLCASNPIHAQVSDASESNISRYGQILGAVETIEATCSNLGINFDVLSKTAGQMNIEFKMLSPGSSDYAEFTAARQKGVNLIKEMVASQAPSAEKRTCSNPEDLVMQSNGLVKIVSAETPIETAQNSPSAPLAPSLPSPSIAPEVAPEPVKPNSSPAAKESAKKLSPADLAVQTHKWDGRLVESSFHCFYADINEFRCMAGFGTVRVDFSTLTPGDRQSLLQDKCDTLKSVNSKSCSVTIQFVYDGFNQQDTGGLGHLRYVRAKDGLGEVVK